MEDLELHFVLHAVDVAHLGYLAKNLLGHDVALLEDDTTPVAQPLLVLDGNELKRRLPKMAHATLFKWLKQMEEDGLVVRTDHGEVPPRVDYSLSELGREFAQMLEAVQAWGIKCIESIEGPRSS